MERKLVLENGREFIGTSFGSTTEAIAELVYNTAVVGYQETLSDPSNCQQIICMAYPVIGNYGLTDEDYETFSNEQNKDVKNLYDEMVDLREEIIKTTDNITRHN